MEEKVIAVSAKGAGKLGLINAPEEFLKGIEIVDELVGGTLGPYGSNRIISRKYASPLVTNDGVTIARYILLKNEIQDLAAQVLVEIALKTNQIAGDGTTGSVVTGAELIRYCLKKATEKAGLAEFGMGGVLPIQLAREIWKELPKALELLKEQQTELSDKMLDDVIATSLENLEYGKTLGDLMREIGKDGYVSTEDNWATKFGIETEITRGMRFLGTYASPYLATERNEKEAIWEDTYVLVTNEKIETPMILQGLVKEMQDQGKMRLVIIGGHSENTNPFSKEFIRGCANLMQAAAKGNNKVIQILAVKAPTLTSDELEDVAVFCDAKFFNKNMGESVKDANLVHCGFAKKISVDEDDVNIIEGRGKTEERVEVLKEQMEREKDTMFKEKMKRRVASLSSAVGIIRVGAPTETERDYLKLKIEDAVNAAKAAMEEGVVPGGGLALKAVAEKLGKENILYTALCAPYNRIMSNAGGEFEVAETVRDAHKVVRVQLENAVSAAAVLISADGGIADRRLTLLDSFEKKFMSIRPHTDDFRDRENQDAGAGRSVA